jgi:hypothetical protein
MPTEELINLFQDINFYFYKVQFFKISTYFPTTPSKADWRSLAGRLSCRDPAYNNKQNSSNASINPPRSMQHIIHREFSLVYFTLTYFLLILNYNCMFWPSMQ